MNALSLGIFHPQTAGAASLYFDGQYSENHTDAQNWYFDDAFTIPANRVPTNTDTVYLAGGTCADTGGLSYATLYVSAGGIVTTNAGAIVIEDNAGTIVTNNGIVNTNSNSIELNSGDGIVSTNNATVTRNCGTITNDYGTAGLCHPIVYFYETVSTSPADVMNWFEDEPGFIALARVPESYEDVVVHTGTLATNDFGHRAIADILLGTTLETTTAGHNITANNGTILNLAAGVSVTANEGTIDVNYGHIDVNNATVTEHYGSMGINNATVTYGCGTIDVNYGVIGDCHPYVYLNANSVVDGSNPDDWYSNVGLTTPLNRLPRALERAVIQEGTCITLGAFLYYELVIAAGAILTSAPEGYIVYSNSGTIDANAGTVSTNYSTITLNSGTVALNTSNGILSGVIVTNAEVGTVSHNSADGTITLNLGTVDLNEGDIIEQCGTVTVDNGTSGPCNTVPTFHSGDYSGSFANAMTAAIADPASTVKVVHDSYSHGPMELPLSAAQAGKTFIIDTGADGAFKYLDLIAAPGYNQTITNMQLTLTGNALGHLRQLANNVGEFTTISNLILVGTDLIGTVTQLDITKNSANTSPWVGSSLSINGFSDITRAYCNASQAAGGASGNQGTSYYGSTGDPGVFPSGSGSVGANTDPGGTGGGGANGHDGTAVTFSTLTINDSTIGMLYYHHAKGGDGGSGGAGGDSSAGAGGPGGDGDASSPNGGDGGNGGNAGDGGMGGTGGNGGNGCGEITPTVTITNSFITYLYRIAYAGSYGYGGGGGQSTAGTGGAGGWGYAPYSGSNGQPGYLGNQGSAGATGSDGTSGTNGTASNYSIVSGSITYIY